MVPCRRPGLFLALVGILAWPAWASAENSRLRRPYVAIAPQGDLEAILRANMEQIGGLEDLDGFLKAIEGSDQWRGLLEGLKDDSARPEKLLKALEDIKNKEPDFLNKATKDFNVDQERLKKTLERLKDTVANGGAGSKDEAENGMNGDPARPDQPLQNYRADSDPGSEMLTTVRDWLKRMEGETGFGELLRDSPAIQKAMAGLVNNAGKGPGLDLIGTTDNLFKAGAFFDNAFSFFENTGGFHMPSWPGLRLPSFSFGRLPSFGVPAFGGPQGAGGGAGLWQVVLWLGVIIAGGLILWQVLSRLKTGGRDPAASAGWHLGPWPVNPSRVATRAELIQAFEYLSLLLLGLPARTWNHRDLAVGMGGAATGGSGERAKAADRLAMLYEQARYAPDAESSPGPALAEARRDLCFLAGVNAS
jgi:hypothetical protein